MARKLKVLSFSFFYIFIAYCGTAFSQPKQVHLSWSGEKTNTSTTITVSWISENPKSTEFVSYGSKDSGFSIVKATSILNSDKAFRKAEIENLKPSTIYSYRCGSDESGWSEYYTFRTAPVVGERGLFKVCVWGDTQNNEFNEDFQKTGQISEYISKIGPAFTLHMGDIVNNGSVTNDWLRFLDISQPVNAHAPLMNTLGNHDIDNTKGEHFQKPFPSFYHYFSLPMNGLDYSFDYGNTHFVCIFSGIANTAADAGILRYQEESEEYKWLEKDLNKANKNKKIDWIIVYTHYPLFSFGWSNVPKWKESISPLLEKYGVDVCLSGHRHVYERHHALKSGHPDPIGKGTIYITNGTAGGSPQGLGGNNLETMAFTSSSKTYNYAIMTIDGNKFIYEVFDLDNKKIDELTIIKEK
jgi:hypothetical protein